MALTDTELQDPSANAPKKARGLLFPLGVASLLLGLLFLLFWVILGQTSDIADPNYTQVQTRRWILIAAGSFLSLQGLALLVVRFAGSEALGAGKARNKLVLNVTLMIALGSMLLVLVNYIFARHELWRLDVTTQKLHTLSEESRALVKNLPAEVRVVLLMPGGADSGQLDRLIAQYEEATHMLRVERYNPRTMEQAEFRAILDELDLSANMTVGELLGIVVQSGEEKDGKWVKARSKHIGQQTLWRRDMSDPSRPRMAFHGEQLISSAIREVIDVEQPKVYFLTGHGELSSQDFDDRTGISRIVKILRQRNLDVVDLNLLDRPKVDVPEDCRLLVVPAPIKPLTDLEVAGVRAYLQGGGRALFCMELVVSKGPRGRAQFHANGLEGMLSKDYGLEVRDELVLLKFYDPRIRGARAEPKLPIMDLAVDHKITSPLALGKARVLFYSARPISTRPTVGVTSKELLTTHNWDTKCFSSTDPVSAEQGPSVMQPGPFAVAVAAEFTPGEKETERKGSRVVVFGDRDWIINQRIAQGAYSNRELLVNTTNWLMHRDELTTGKIDRPPSNRLDMDEGTLIRVQGLACLGMPAIALALGLFAWMIRSRT